MPALNILRTQLADKLKITVQHKSIISNSTDVWNVILFQLVFFLFALFAPQILGGRVLIQVDIDRKEKHAHTHDHPNNIERLHIKRRKKKEYVE